MKKVLKIMRKLLFWLFFTGLFFTTVVTVILHIYEDEIKEYAISELNKNLTTPVEVRNIELSILHDFPYASLAFEHVFVADAFENVESNDTLFFAEELFLHFSLLDIWREDYKVKHASIHEGNINLKTTEEGDVNYNIVAEKEDSTTTNNFSFLLELLRVEDVNFRFANQSTRQFYDIDIHKVELRGDFAAEKYQLNSQGELYVNQLKSSSLTLISNKNAVLDLALDINTTNKRYQFNKGDLNLEEMQFNITGMIDSSNIDLNIKGEQIQVSQLVNSLIPEDLEDPKEYGGEGLVDFTASIVGAISRQDMPSIQAKFAVENGAIIEPENKLKIEAINLLGSYQNEQKEREELLSFDNFQFKLLNSSFNGLGRIKNFEQPTLETKAKGDLDLRSFNQFFAFKDVEELSGRLEMDLSTIIQFFDPEYRKDKFKIIQSKGNIHLEKVIYKSINEALRYQDISGNILINGKDAAVRDMVIKTQNSNLVLNGAMKNFIPYIEGSGNLGLIASLESSQVDLNEFLGPSNSEKTGPPTLFELPGDLNLNVEMNLKQFLWDGHTFNDITGQLLLANRKITINRIKMKTLGGAVRGKLVLNNRLTNGNIIDGNMRFNQINVKQLFSEWDNFQQQSITDEHLSGKVKGEVEFLLLFNPYFSLLEDRIYVNSNIQIDDGALQNLETMKAITDYMRSNKALKLMLNKHIDRFEEKLMNLQFSEMKNQIEIKERRIRIPKMIIRTNALDVELFGWHDFDNNIEYHFSFRFRQLKSKPEYTEFGKIEDDGLGIVIYMTMAGTIDEPEFSLDKEERKKDLKENLEQERSTVKSMLKSEFGLFQKDSTVKALEIDNKKEVEFIFYEDDIEAEEEKEKSDTTKKPRNKKRVGKFFDKLKEEAEKDKNKVEYETEL